MGIFKNDKAKAAERSAGAGADSAVEGRPHGDHGTDGPHSRPIKPLGEHEKPDQLAEKEKHAEDRQEALLDEGLEESFPSSDPVSVKRIT